MAIWFGVRGYGPAWPVASLVALVGGLGFLDDLREISPLIRFPVQAVAMTALVWVLGPLPPISVVANLSIGGFVLSGFVIVAGLWWLNLFNFFDGIDGIAASHAIIVLIAGTLLSWSGLNGDVAPIIWLAWATAATTGGFLLQNWPPARIFMGVVGSNALAVVIFTLALASIASGLVSYAAWITLVSASVSDTTVTLLRRIARRQKPWQAHRSHAYQQMSRLKGHRSTTILYSLLTLLWAVPMAAVAQKWPDIGWSIALTTYLPLLVFSLWLGAGSQIERSKITLP